MHAVAAQRSARQFARGRVTWATAGPGAAAKMAAGRAQHAALLAAQNLTAEQGMAATHSVTAGQGVSSKRGVPVKQGVRSVLGASAQAVPLSTAWQAVGPSQVLTAAYGLVTGRVSSIAIDPADITGNTVYLGTTGGGVWRSTNAAGPVASVRFIPLTDTLPAFSANSATSAVPSLSIGAVSVQPGSTGVVLAGTGDPNDALDSYYGTGLLRSADNGQTWALIAGSDDGVAGHHSFFGQGFAGFAWSSTSPQLVVTAVSSSAEGTITHASGAGSSVRGLYYSTDAGATWQMSTLVDDGQPVQSAASNFSGYEGNAVTSVVWNPVRQRFYAAVRFHGYYESVDGVLFTRLAAQPGPGLSATACPARSGSVGLQSCPIFRGAVAAQPISGDLFALTVDSTNGDKGLFQDTCAMQGNLCSNAVVAWSTQLNSSPMDDGNGVLPQADYNLALAAVPAATALSMTDTLLFAGTSEIFRCSLSGGCALRNTTNATTGCAAPAMVSPSQHAIAWQGNAANTAEPLLYFGNDGGLWRSLDGVRQQSTPCSTDDATHFNNLNGAIGSLAEVSSLASDPSSANTLLVALGANGSAAASSVAQATAQSAWLQLGTGEGGGVAIDQAQPLNWYVQSGGGVAFHGCTKGSACTASDFAGPPAIGLAQVSSDSSLTATPFLLDPALNTNVLIGTCRVWRGPVTGGTAWSSGNALSPPLTGPNEPSCSALNADVRSLGAGGAVALPNSTQNSGSTVLYAGMAGVGDGGGNFGGRIFVTSAADTANGTTPWTDITGGPVVNGSGSSGQFNPDQYDVSAFAVDAHDPSGATVYATVMGFDVAHVYRSSDRGGTWMNVTANLPNAPANAVVVDPNDAATVYVAMDTGVYVTSAIASCATSGAQCWSAYGTALPNAPAISLVASANVTVPSALAPGALRVGTYGRGIWQIPLLTSGPLASPVATITPGSLTFAGQAVNTTSAPQTLTVTNSGNVPLLVARVAASAQWSETDSCTGTTLAVGGSCTIAVSFSPASTGGQTGTLTVFANVPGGYVTANLSGTGTTASPVALTPATLFFAATGVGSTSAAQTVIVTNAGAGIANLQPASITGNFVITANTCTATLASGSTCSLSVAFAPSAEGTRAGRLSLVDGDGNHTVGLSGGGTAGHLSATPTSLNFLDTTVSTTSAAESITVTNTGMAPLAIGSVSPSGDFSETDICAGKTLAVKTTCIVSVSFTPTATGARAGTLTLTSNSGGSAGNVFSIALAGSGKGAFNIVLLPQSLDFASVLVGSTSAVQNITISNTGIHSGALSTAAVTSDFVLKANTCGATLAPQTGCTVSVAFSPSTNGRRTGVFSISDDAGTQTATLTGVGSLPATDTLSPLSLAFSTQQIATTSAGQQITLSNSGDEALTLISADIANGDFTAVNGCGPTLPAHGSCAITVAFSPNSIGVLTGTLFITDVQRVQRVDLTGIAIAGPGVSLTPASLRFSNTGSGNASAGQTATLTNNGGVPLSITAMTTSGDFGIIAGTNTCSIGTPLLVGTSCMMQIAFVPSGAGGRTGKLTISSNAADKTVQLDGTGIDFSLNPNGPATAIIHSGASATYALLLRPVVTVNEPVTFLCTGAPANALCSVVATYPDLAAVNSVAVTLATGVRVATASAKYESTLFARGTMLAFASFLPWIGFVYGARRRGMRVPLLLLLCACTVAGMAGCGAGRLLPQIGNATGGSGSGVVTPSGSYPITVSATSAGLTKQVTLTLMVQ